MVDFIFEHKKMGTCKVCGEPIWTTVTWGSGVYPHGMCWDCARKTGDYDLVRFDYCKVTPEEEKEYRDYLRKKCDLEVWKKKEN